MRLRFGVAMPDKGGRTAIVGVEVFERYDERSDRYVHRFVVGHIERVTPGSVDAARDRVKALMNATADQFPCALVDVGNPQGMALRQELRDAYDSRLHRPHAYLGTGERRALFSVFLQAYAAGEVRFEPGLKFRADLDKALVFYMGGGVAKSGVELESEDEALVIALGLALYWPKHGIGSPRSFVPDALRAPRTTPVPGHVD